MTQSLVRKLLNKGYKTIGKLNDIEIAVSKVTIDRVNDETNFDVYTLNKNESCDLEAKLNENGKLELTSLKTLLKK